MKQMREGASPGLCLCVAHPRCEGKDIIGMIGKLCYCAIYFIVSSFLPLPPLSLPPHQMPGALGLPRELAQSETRGVGGGQGSQDDAPHRTVAHYRAFGGWCHECPRRGGAGEYWRCANQRDHVRRAPGWEFKVLPAVGVGGRGQGNSIIPCDQQRRLCPSGPHGRPGLPPRWRGGMVLPQDWTVRSEQERGRSVEPVSLQGL